MTEKKVPPVPVLSVLALLFLGNVLQAQDTPAPPANPSDIHPSGTHPSDIHPLDKLTFKIVVFGPSDSIFIWWGHAGLIVEDRFTNYARIYDWGIFSYPGESFVRSYALNKIRYRCGVSPARWDIEANIAEDRDVVVYTLDLEPSKKEAILHYADNNVRTENCWYVYHQFRDNCSTRIRDLIDMGTGGQLRNHFENMPGRLTLREHMRRFTWYSPFYDWFLGFLLGRGIDRNSTMWEEMYLPLEVGRNIEGFSYIDDSGAERKLVTNMEIVNKTKNRRAVLDAPRNEIPRTLMAGLAIALLPVLARLLQRKRPLAGRVLLGISHSVVGLALGIAGTVLLFASRVPERDYMRSNINLLYANPLALAVIPLGIMAALGRKVTAGAKFSPNAGLRAWWLYICAACAASALINVLPFLRQHNLPTLALIFPVALVLSLPERYS